MKQNDCLYDKTSCPVKFKKLIFLVCFFIIGFTANAQLSWIKLDSLYRPLPTSMHVYKSTTQLNGKPNVVYYVIADLKDKSLNFTVDTSSKRRLTPKEFFQKDDHPIVVVNASFFSFATNRNLNAIIKDGKLVAYNEISVPAKGKDTLTYYHSFDGAFGISKDRNADVAWLYTDSSKKYAYASESVINSIHDSVAHPSFNYIDKKTSMVVVHFAAKNASRTSAFEKWKMQTAVGGGPVLIQNNQIEISNNEERKFAGKAIADQHPRTAIGYTADNKIIILVAEGRSETASGLTLIQEADILKDLGCIEALNLDGGGSTCMLVNGKQTNSPSDKEGQRSVPSVFIIKKIK